MHSSRFPGGYGTLDEMVEGGHLGQQLGMHAKPCVLHQHGLDYWNGLLEFLDTAVDAGFLRPANRALLQYGRRLQPRRSHSSMSNEHCYIAALLIGSRTYPAPAILHALMSTKL